LIASETDLKVIRKKQIAVIADASGFSMLHHTQNKQVIRLSFNRRHHQRIW